MNPEHFVKTHLIAHPNSLQKYQWDPSLSVSEANDSVMIINFS